MQSLYQIPHKSCGKQERQAFWERVIAAQSISGIGIKKFCRQHQLQFSTMRYWKYIKKKARVTCNSGYKLNDRQSYENTSKFIPLQIARDMPIDRDAKDKAICVSDTEIQIVFKNGHKLTLPLAVSEIFLLSIIKTVAGIRC